MSRGHFIKSFEWCTKLPKEGYPLETLISLQQGCECLFKFILEKFSGSWYYELYVEIKSGQSTWTPCNVKILVGFKNEENLSLGEGNTGISGPEELELWCKERNTLRSKLPSDYVKGNWIKFQFCFQDMARQIKVDKCLQTGSYLNAHVPVETLTEDMSKLLDTGIDHDAEIKCGEHTIKVHKNILCARSEVFKAMLQSDMLEGRTGVVKIQDMDETYIQDFVRYLYTGSMPELSFEEAKVLYEAGDKYAVRGLVLRCSEYLQDTLSLENAFECLALADAHSDEKLINSIIEFALRRKMYLRDELWSLFCEKYPKVVVKVYRLLHENDIDRQNL